LCDAGVVALKLHPCVSGEIQNVLHDFTSKWLASAESRNGIAVGVNIPNLENTSAIGAGPDA
jgi:hypothetical protein